MNPIKKTEHTVKVYSTPMCPWCVRVKDFLKEHKIKFQDIDISKDAKVRDYIVKKSGQIGVPVVEIGDKVIIGFDEEEIRNALNL